MIAARLRVMPGGPPWFQLIDKVVSADGSCGLWWRNDVLIDSGELYPSLGGHPGSTHGMPSCCDAMQAEMKLGDTMLLDRSSGAGVTVRYLLPRAN